MTRLHLAAESSGPLGMSACGWPGVDVTDDHAAVTCRLCAKHMARMAAEGTQDAPDGPKAYVDALAAGDTVEPPVLTHKPFVVDAERWRRHRQGCACGSCDVCRHVLAIRVEQHTDPYRRRIRAKTAPIPPRWSSVSAALETYVSHRIDGYPVKAWGGTLEMVRTLGHLIQSEGAYSSAAERAAHDVVHVEHAIREAYEGGVDCGEMRCVGRNQAAGILLACGVGRLQRDTDASGRTVQRYVPVPMEEVAEVYGLPLHSVRQIVKHGRDRVGKRLAERGLVPERGVR